MKPEERVAQRISSADNVLIVCHVAPDGDAIGSLLGLGLALDSLNQSSTLACEDPVPEHSRHLPQWERITQTPQNHFDLVVSLDCSDLARLGSAYDAEVLSGVPIVNIDHHATNVQFGQINWVDVRAASTTQMVARLIVALRADLTPDVATCLLGGILTDTLGFRTSNTTAEVLETAIQLMRAGASLPDLTDKIFNHRPLGVVRMWFAALEDLHLEDRILWSQVTQTMRQRIGYGENGDAGLVSFLNTVDEADIAVVFDELPDGQVNVSIRAVAGYDISQVALSFGGGGHPQAAGCTLNGPLEEARAKVLSKLGRARDEQTASR